MIMKTFICLGIVLGVLFAHVGCFKVKKLIGKRQKYGVSTSIRDASQDLYFDQLVDHFNGANTNTWKQRYFVNDQYYVQNRPVFIYISGETAASSAEMTTGFWIDQAKILGALCVMLEHRYYGITIPTPDLSTDNLQYLSSLQALEDLAAFRQFIQQQYGLGDATKWISFGGSYAGALSAWFRLKYPNLVYAAVASSAPVLAKYDFAEYYQVVNASLSQYSLKCTQQIKKATQLIDRMVKTNFGKANLQSIFSLCAPLLSQKDVQTFYTTLADNIAEVVQYNQLLQSASIGSICDVMTNTILGNPLQRYASLLSTTNQGCLDSSYSDTVAYYQNTTFDSSNPGSARQWLYQTCTEFGYFQSSDSPNQPFGSSFPVSFYSNLCSDVFGQNFTDSWITRQINDTNTDYGGLNYAASRVVFVNGNVDPWHALSFTQSAPNNQTQIIYINGTAHCADMYSDGPNDSDDLLNARKQISTIISNWLNSS